MSHSSDVNSQISAATVSFTVNGRAHTVAAHPMSRLIDILRTELRLTSCKEGCGEGECGACTVVMDGQLVNSCLVPLLQAQNSVITTAEHVETTEVGAVLQRCFLECGGAQCGICTPAMVVSSAHLLEEHRAKKSLPTIDDIRVGLAGNLCRCTGYGKIFDAVQTAAKEVCR